MATYRPWPERRLLSEARDLAGEAQHAARRLGNGLSDPADVSLSGRLAELRAAREGLAAVRERAARLDKQIQDWMDALESDRPIAGEERA